MEKVEFKLSMPNRNSWNGKWFGDGRDYLIFKTLTDKKIAFLGLDKGNQDWYYRWDDGWCACVSARILVKGERKKKSMGFCGYDWMVDEIISNNEIREQK